MLKGTIGISYHLFDQKRHFIPLLKMRRHTFCASDRESLMWYLVPEVLTKSTILTSKYQVFLSPLFIWEKTRPDTIEDICLRKKKKRKLQQYSDESINEEHPHNRIHCRIHRMRIIDMNNK